MFLPSFLFFYIKIIPQSETKPDWEMIYFIYPLFTAQSEN